MECVSVEGGQVRGCPSGGVSGKDAVHGLVRRQFGKKEGERFRIAKEAGDVEGGSEVMVGGGCGKQRKAGVGRRVVPHGQNPADGFRGLVENGEVQGVATGAAAFGIEAGVAQEGFGDFRFAAAYGYGQGVLAGGVEDGCGGGFKGAKDRAGFGVAV